MSLGHDLLCNGYEKLLKETAITHSSKLRVQPSRAARNVHEHAVEHCNDLSDPGEELDIDLSAETILANKSMTKFKSTNLMLRPIMLKMNLMA